MPWKKIVTCTPVPDCDTRVTVETKLPYRSIRQREVAIARANEALAETKQDLSLDLLCDEWDD